MARVWPYKADCGAKKGAVHLRQPTEASGTADPIFGAWEVVARRESEEIFQVLGFDFGLAPNPKPYIPKAPEHLKGFGI